MIEIKSLWFDGNGNTELRTAMFDGLTADQILVKTFFSGISSGSERLALLGQLPADISVDATIDSLEGRVQYPMQYGYTLAGRIEKTGKNISDSWVGKSVFMFHPHQSKVITSLDDVLILPDDFLLEQAVFIPNTETAVSLIHDGRPMIGERAIVFGAGVVGQLVTEFLAGGNLAKLTVVDPIASRRNLALQAGATNVLTPAEAEKITGEYDLVFELTGRPAVLNNAIQVAATGARIVVGSWYGNRPTNLNLGGRFHREHLQIISSQVSSLSPVLAGTWTKKRRMDFVVSLIQQKNLQPLISNRTPFNQATQIYDQLAQNQLPEDLMQVIFTY